MRPRTAHGARYHHTGRTYSPSLLQAATPDCSAPPSSHQPLEAAGTRQYRLLFQPGLAEIGGMAATRISIAPPEHRGSTSGNQLLEVADTRAYRLLDQPDLAVIGQMADHHHLACQTRDLEHRDGKHMEQGQRADSYVERPLGGPVRLL